MRSIKKGSASQSVYFEFLDSTSTTGGRKTGLAYNTSSLAAYYVRNGGSATAITLATLAAANSAWSSGGFKEVDATNMPGVYRLDVPDAAFASGAESVVITMKGATGMAQASLEIALVDNTSKDTYDRIGAPVGASISNDIAGVQADTDNIQTRIPAALVSGRIDASVGAMASDVLTSTALAASAVTEIQSGLSTLDAAGVRSAIGLASANLDTQLAAIDDYIDTEVAAIKAKTDNLPVDPADASDIAASFASLASTLSTIAGYIDTEVAAIKAKTDNLPADPADASDIAASFSTVNTTLATIAGYIDTEVAAIKAKTDLIPGTQDGYTFAQLTLLMAAALLGKASGLATTTAVYRALDDSKDRITATVDADGNRSAVTRDAT